MHTQGTWRYCQLIIKEERRTVGRHKRVESKVAATGYCTKMIVDLHNEARLGYRGVISFANAPSTSRMTLDYNRRNAELNVLNDSELLYRLTLYSLIKPLVVCNDCKVLYFCYAPHLLHGSRDGP